MSVGWPLGSALGGLDLNDVNWTSHVVQVGRKLRTIIIEQFTTPFEAACKSFVHLLQVSNLLFAIVVRHVTKSCATQRVTTAVQEGSNGR